MFWNLISMAQTKPEMPTTKRNVITRIRIVTWWLLRQMALDFFAFRLKSLKVTTESSKVKIYFHQVLNVFTSEICVRHRTGCWQLIVRFFGLFFRICYADVIDRQNIPDVLQHLLLLVEVWIEHGWIVVKAFSFCVGSVEVFEILNAQQQRIYSLSAIKRFQDTEKLIKIRFLHNCCDCWSMMMRTSFVSNAIRVSVPCGQDTFDCGRV